MPTSELGRYRVALLAVVIIMALIKLLIAASTFGTDDVARWMDFAAGVAEVGPVDVYQLRFDSLYNHPPLIGYMLLAINAATRHGLDFPFAIRMPAISADAITPFLVLELLRLRRPLRESFAAAASVAMSPVLIVVSGFHGNTDPVFIMFALLSVYLLVDRRAPALAGLAIATALGVKIVPIVIVPSLLVFAYRIGRRPMLRFAFAAGALLALIWGPAVIRAGHPLVDNVLGYTGGRQSWGLVQLGDWIGNPSWVTWLEGPGRYLVVIAVTVPTAAVVLRRPWRVVEASALALTGLLALSPAFGMQYVVWALAPAYLLSFWGATAYNLAASCLLIWVYTRWNGGLPWYFARSTWLTPAEIPAALGVWMSVLTVVGAGIRRCVWTGQPPLTVSNPAARPEGPG